MKKDIKDRLIEKRIVDPVTNCWLYTGAKYSNGYGFIKYQGKAHLVHRLSLMIFKDIIFDEGEQSNHNKECPHKHCFNPDHLYKGTQTDNMGDRYAKVNKKTKSQKNREYYARHNKDRKNFGRLVI